MTIEELSDEMKNKKARCKNYCVTYNTEDNDCEIYGENHPGPSRCSYFLKTELERRNKEEE